jgi:hypothetical protein
MGKLIISETERKNILSLYEATTVAPPPSESVLVVNKNPFKYPEYKLSRKLYSTQLKDGDTFYILSKQNNIITSYNEIINNLIKIYQEKSIRYNDEIVKISMKLNEYSSGKLDKDYFIPEDNPVIIGGKEFAKTSAHKEGALAVPGANEDAFRGQAPRKDHLPLRCSLPVPI